MKRKFKVLTVTLAISAIGISSVFAWGGHALLRPGDHVIDVKRLSDSVLETAKQAIVYTQTLQEIQNKLKMMEKIDPSAEVVSAAKDANTNAKLEGIMADNATADSLFAFRVNDVSPMDAWRDQQGTFIDQARIEEQKGTQGRFVTINAMIQRSADRMNKVGKIMAMKTDGLTGEMQRKNALDALSAMEIADIVRVRGARLLENIQHDEIEKREKQYNDDKASRSIATKFLDPYKTSEFKNAFKDKIKVKTSPLGFPDL